MLRCVAILLLYEIKPGMYDLLYIHIYMLSLISCSNGVIPTNIPRWNLRRRNQKK